jgi:hypothetical protein
MASEVMKTDVIWFGLCRLCELGLCTASVVSLTGVIGSLKIPAEGIVFKMFLQAVNKHD